MRHAHLWLLSACAACLAAVSSCGERERPRTGREVLRGMKLTSPKFACNAKIPPQFTRDGADVNPALEITGVPDAAKSLVLIVDDPDAPAGTWVHWVVYDIPPAVKRIEQDSVPGTQGRNSSNKLNYGGPSPPSGTHRYFFKLYALDHTTGLKEGATKQQVEAAMDGHILAQAELVGLYQRQKQR